MLLEEVRAAEGGVITEPRSDLSYGKRRAQKIMRFGAICKPRKHNAPRRGWHLEPAIGVATDF